MSMRKILTMTDLNKTRTTIPLRLYYLGLAGPSAKKSSLWIFHLDRLLID
jgi:hypothetical protein